MKAGTLKMQNDKTVKNCGGKTTSPKTKEIQEQCIATDEIQEYNLDQVGFTRHPKTGAALFYP